MYRSERGERRVVEREDGQDGGVGESVERRHPLSPYCS